jgi:hypothetical protein
LVSAILFGKVEAERIGRQLAMIGILISKN